MLVLLFQIGKDRYAIDTAEIIEIIPRVNTQPIPHTSDHVLGVVDYHGDIMPVIDLCQLIGDYFAADRYSTRIIVAAYQDKWGKNHPLGLIAEKVMETVWEEEKSIRFSGVSTEESPYLGELVSEQDGMVQFVDVAKLLTDELHDMLFIRTEKR